MSRLLLDTSAYSSLFRGDAEAREAVDQAQEVALSSIVLGELLAGFARGKHRVKNERELEEFLAMPGVTIVEIGEETAKRYATIVAGLRDAGTPIPTNDVWIAASAMQHGLEILSADAHFERVKQVVVRRIGRSQ